MERTVRARGSKRRQVAGELRRCNPYADAYSYAYDDQASTYTCGSAALRPDYDIIFCP